MPAAVLMLKRLSFVLMLDLSLTCDIFSDVS